MDRQAPQTHRSGTTDGPLDARPAQLHAAQSARQSSNDAQPQPERRVYPHADLQLADIDGDMLTVVDRRECGAGDELFMRTHSADAGGGVGGAATWLKRHQVQELRDFLDRWLGEADVAEPAPDAVTPRSVLSRALVGAEPYNQAADVLDNLQRWGYTVAPIAEPLAEWERELLEAHEDGSDCYGQCATEATAGQDGWAEGQLCTITAEAERAVYGDRQQDYGHPREDFTRTAIIWTGLLHHKLADGAHLEPEDVARCMIGVKLARDVHAPKRDNRVDMAGYALTLDRLETGQ